MQISTIVLPLEANDASRHRLLRKAQKADRLYMQALARKHFEAIGFLPGQAITEAIDQGRVLLGLENGDPAGYLLFKHRMPDNPGVTAIFQAVVQMDARRHSLGRELVASVVRTAELVGNKIVQLWCAEGLEANEFWPAAGFTPVALRQGGKRRNRLHVLWRISINTASPRAFPISRRRRVPAGPPILIPETVTLEQIVTANRTRTLANLLENDREKSTTTTPREQQAATTSLFETDE